MEIKKINKLLLGIFTLHIVFVALVTMFPDIFQIGIILNLSLGEIILFAPTLVYLFFWAKRAAAHKQEDRYEEMQEMDTISQKETLWQRLHFNNVKPATFLYVLLNVRML